MHQISAIQKVTQGHAAIRSARLGVSRTKVLLALCAFAFGLSAARISLAGIPTLIGMTALAVCLMGNFYPLCALVGCCAGFFMQSPQANPLLLFSYLALFVLWRCAAYMGVKRRRAVLFVFMSASLALPWILTQEMNPEAWLILAVGLLLQGAVCGMLLELCHGFSLQKLNLSDTAAWFPAAFALCLFTAGLCGLRFYWVPAGNLFACFCVLLAVRIWGVAATAPGLALGVSLTIMGGAIHLPLLLGVVALTAGLLPRHRPILHAGVLVGLAWALPWVLDIPGFSLVEVAAAGTCAVLFGGPLTAMLQVQDAPPTKLDMPHAAAACAQLFAQTAAFFEPLPQLEQPAQALTTALRAQCADCPRVGGCFEREQLQPLIQAACANPATPAVMSEVFEKRCVYPDEVLEKVHEMQGQMLILGHSQGRADVSVSDVARRLHAVEGWMHALSEPPPRMSRAERWLERQLQDQGIQADTVRCLRPERPLVQLRFAHRPTAQQMEWLEKTVTHALGRPMAVLPPEREEGMVSFAPKARIQLTIGRARVAKAANQAGHCAQVGKAGQGGDLAQAGITAPAAAAMDFDHADWDAAVAVGNGAGLGASRNASHGVGNGASLDTCSTADLGTRNGTSLGTDSDADLNTDDWAALNAPGAAASVDVMPNEAHDAFPFDGPLPDPAVPCGDCFEQINLADGRILLLVCDGMGAGAEAERLARGLCAMLKTLFAMNLPTADILAGVNTLLCTSGGVRTAALDVLVIDPSAARLRWHKMGACPSLLVRNRQVLGFAAQTLPMGAIAEAAPEARVMDLHPGDNLLLCTDGVWDNITPRTREQIAQGLHDQPVHAAAKGLIRLADGSDDALAVVVRVERVA